MSSRASQEQQPPRRAPNVHLVGEQRDTGFQDRQWLVRRDARFIQLTELLYRVLEQIDGSRNLESIAARVTEATQWTVTAEHVRQLIEAKLVPAGLVASRDHSQSLPGAESRPRSPLAVIARRTIIGPRLLEPITRPLRSLYAPFVLIPLLTCIGLAHLWLYLDHGVEGAIRDVIVHPALVLPATLIFIATTMFHELGHASALRYGGGEARRIGVGVYLMYPVFFTDTTDAYRLGRWARVRVDLGGFYFQLIAAVVLMGLASVTGHQWLLLPAFIVSLEVLRQLLFPFVRLDGYWLFADLTGIPDFFSQMGPFARSLLPGSRRGATLPPLRRGTRAVFFAYMIATIPILAFLLFQLATHAPGLLEAAWTSLQAQRDGLAHALGSGDVAGAAGSLGQMLILVMPALTSVLLTVVLVGWAVSTAARRRRLVAKGA